MQYNAPPGSTDPNAGYTNGVPGLVKGSPVNGLAVEYVQREIINVITAGGLTPANNELDQLLRSIEAIIQEAVPPAPEKYELGEYYFFRHPTLRSGMQPCFGGLIANAATLWPEIWAYLQTTEGQLLCKTEAQWQALSVDVFRKADGTPIVLADGTSPGWNGVGGVDWFAPDFATGALRLPDIRGMYAEAAGFDSLDVGAVHPDMIRNIVGSASAWSNTGQIASGGIVAGAITRGTQRGNIASGTSGTANDLVIDISRVHPAGNKVAPRAYGVLPCIYLGRPAS